MALESATYIQSLSASNPTTSDKRAQGDDHLRLIKAVLKATLLGTDHAIPLEVAAATVASASAPAIGAAASNFIYITGTTTITGFDTVAAGIWRFIRFADALTFTHNATSLILPGAANITTATNDCALAVSLGSGNWLVLFYQKASGAAIGGVSAAEMLTLLGTLSAKTTLVPADRFLVFDSADSLALKYTTQAKAVPFAVELGPLAAEQYSLAAPAGLDLRNGHPVLDFDDTTQEYAQWTFRLPATYGGGGLTVEVYFSATSATSGNVYFDAAVERIGEEQLDVDSDSFASAQTSSATATSTTSGYVKKATVAFTDGAQMDSLAAGELGRLKISRTTGGSVSGDVEVHRVVVKET